MALTEQWTRVILLIPPAPQARDGGGEHRLRGGCALSESLQAQFVARDWFAIQVNDPCLALAELCLREKSQIARAAWGLQRLEQIGLVVFEPRQWEAAGIALGELTQAIERYVPAASVWHASDDQLIAVYRPAPASDSRSASTAYSTAVRPHPANHESNSHGPSVAILDVQRRHTHAAVRQTHGNDLRIASAPGATLNGDCSPTETDVAGHTRLTREEIEMLLDPIQLPQSEVAS